MPTTVTRLPRDHTPDPSHRPAWHLLAGRHCEHVQWRHIHLGDLLLLPGRRPDRFAILQVIRSADGPWALRVVATPDGSGLGIESAATLPLGHLVWRVLDRAGNPARVDPAARADLSLAAGAVVRYHGDLSDHHGTYLLILATDPNDLVLRSPDGILLMQVRATAVDVLA